MELGVTDRYVYTVIETGGFVKKHIKNVLFASLSELERNDFMRNLLDEGETSKNIWAAKIKLSTDLRRTSLG